MAAVLPWSAPAFASSSGSARRTSSLSLKKTSICNKNMMEKLKRHLFDAKVPKDIAPGARNARQLKQKPITPMKRSIPVLNGDVRLSKLLKSKWSRKSPSICTRQCPPSAAFSLSSRDHKRLPVSPSLRNLIQKPNCSPTCAEARALKSIPSLQALSERLESLRHLSSRLAGIEESDDGS